MEHSSQHDVREEFDKIALERDENQKNECILAEKIAVKQEESKSHVEQIAFNEFVQPRNEKLMNEIDSTNNEWYDLVEATAAQRDQLIAYTSTKMSNLVREEAQLHTHITKRNLDVMQLEATVANLEESLAKIRPQNQQLKEEIANLHDSQLVADKRQSELKEKIKIKKELLIRRRSHCSKSADELESIKKKFSVDKEKSKEVDDELQQKRLIEKDILKQKLHSEVAIEQLRKQLKNVESTSAHADEAVKKELERLESEHNQQMIEKRTQRLHIEVGIQDIAKELQSIEHETDVANAYINAANAEEKELNDQKLELETLRQRHIQLNQQQPLQPQVIARTSEKAQAKRLRQRSRIANSTPSLDMVSSSHSPLLSPICASVDNLDSSISPNDRQNKRI